MTLLPTSGVIVESVKVCGKIVDAEVYLIEARSIGGLSGCPVFVSPTETLTIPNAVNQLGETQSLAIRFPGTYYLMGLMHRHWDIDPEEKNEAEPVKTRPYAVNLGIAVVVPARKILEVIYHPELVTMREKCEQKRRDAESSTTPDQEDCLLDYKNVDFGYGNDKNGP